MGNGEQELIKRNCRPQTDFALRPYRIHNPRPVHIVEILLLNRSILLINLRLHESIAAHGFSLKMLETKLQVHLEAVEVNRVCHGLELEFIKNPPFFWPLLCKRRRTRYKCYAFTTRWSHKNLLPSNSDLLTQWLLVLDWSRVGCYGTGRADSLPDLNAWPNWPTGWVKQAVYPAKGLAL